jgi:hypothetical protein
MTHDSLMVLLDDIRASRPPCYLADEWTRWLQACAQCLLALPTEERQWAASVLVAGDIMQASPGIPMALAYGIVQEAMQRAAQVRP